MNSNSNATKKIQDLCSRQETRSQDPNVLWELGFYLYKLPRTLAMSKHRVSDWLYEGNITGIKMFIDFIIKLNGCFIF